MSTKQTAGSATDAVGSSRNYWLAGRLNTSKRLHLQHFMWKKQFPGWLPTNVDTQAPGLRIADLGTGNGIWLSDLAESVDLHPTAQLDGFDINTHIFPPSDQLDPRIQLHLMDATEPDLVPLELVGTFDVVSARTLATLFTNGDPSRFLRVVEKLLKPGGYLQWIDFTIGKLRVIPPASSRPEVTAEATQKVSDIIQLFYQGRDILPEYFEDWDKRYGLIKEEHEITVTRPSLWGIHTECFMEVAEAYGVRVESSDVVTQHYGRQVTAKEWHELFLQAEEECTRGVAWLFDKNFRILARKPM